MPSLTYTTNGTTHTIPYTRHNFPVEKFRELGGGDIEFLVSPAQDATCLALVELLKVWMGFCDQHDVVWWAHSGTLIGALRHKGLIPWDNDIDLGIKFHDYKRIREITGPDYEVEFVPGYLLVKSGAGYRVKRVGHILPFIDIFASDTLPDNPNRSHHAGPIARRPDGTYLRLFYCADFWHKEWIDVKDLDTSTTPLPTLPFEGIDIPVPHNALETAQRHYGTDVIQYMHYSDATNGFWHSETIFEFTRLERIIDLLSIFTYATGLDVMTEERDYQLNVSGILMNHILRICESEFPDTESLDRVLNSMRDDWMAFLTKRAMRLLKK